MVPSSRSGSKTNFVVAKLYVHFYAAVVLGCVADRITNITQKCIKLTIPWIQGSSKWLLPHENPGGKWENMIAFATKIPQISSPVAATSLFCMSPATILISQGGPRAHTCLNTVGGHVVVASASWAMNEHATSKEDVTAIVVSTGSITLQYINLTDLVT